MKKILPFLIVAALIAGAFVYLNYSGKHAHTTCDDAQTFKSISYSFCLDEAGDKVSIEVLSGELADGDEFIKHIDQSIPDTHKYATVYLVRNDEVKCKVPAITMDNPALYSAPTLWGTDPVSMAAVYESWIVGN